MRNASVGHDATHLPHRSQPESMRPVIGDWPRLHTTSHAVQPVQAARSSFTVTGDALPSSENTAPPGHSERQKPARETNVSKMNANATSADPAPRPPKNTAW